MPDFTQLTQSFEYSEGLETVLKLSRLFSDSKAAPFLHYRIAENLYCQFVKGSKNLGREDIAIDSKTQFLNGNKKEVIGVGIKTFLHNNGYTLQKIAEFNKDKTLYDHLSPKEKIKKIAELRNVRLQFCIDTHDLTGLQYHCITRSNDGIVRIYNTSMDFIDIDSIKDINISDASISFNDKLNEYSFNLSKSTLFKRFDFKEIKPVKEFKVSVEENPLDILMSAFKEKTSYTNEGISKDYIVLPLYSFTATRGKYVPEKSALNIWNAAGRPRDPNEAYIGVSKKIHQFLNKKYENDSLKFFPDRDTPFTLVLPNGEHLEAKLCQEDCKALMTNPNKKLGEWLLRKVLKLPEGTILTYKKLLEVGIDSVKITQENITEDELMYSIDFCAIGSYDDFVLQNDI